jgi:hypothetical protein
LRPQRIGAWTFGFCRGTSIPHPDHDSLCVFRKAHLAELAGLFVQVLQLCDKAGLIGTGPVCVDGTKILANASIRANRTEKSLVAEQALLDEQYELMAQSALAQADKIDAEEDDRFGKGNRGDMLPTALHDRQSRSIFIKEALDAIKKQAAEESSKAKAASNTDSSAAAESGGDAKPPRKGGKLKEPKVKECKVNVTDPDSRIMRDGATKAYVQAYNAQAAVDSRHQIILAAELTQDANDKKQLVPVVARAAENLGQAPKQVLADSGYFSEAQVTDPTLKDIDLLVPPDRACTAGEVDEHALGKLHEEEVLITSGGRFVKYVEAPTPADTMRARLSTPEGRRAYAKRSATVEPVFGQIKEATGFRRFLMRGIKSVAHEWTLICMASNIKKLFRADAIRKKTEADTSTAPSTRTCVQNSRQFALDMG